MCSVHVLCGGPPCNSILGWLLANCGPDGLLTVFGHFALLDVDQSGEGVVQLVEDSVQNCSQERLEGGGGVKN